MKEIKRQPISQSWWAEPPVGKDAQVKYFSDFTTPENFIRMSALLTIFVNLSAKLTKKPKKIIHE